MNEPHCVCRQVLSHEKPGGKSFTLRGAVSAAAAGSRRLGRVETWQETPKKTRFLRAAESTSVDVSVQHVSLTDEASSMKNDVEKPEGFNPLSPQTVNNKHAMSAYIFKIKAPKLCA